jgi:hypothetical protein
MFQHSDHNWISILLMDSKLQQVRVILQQAVDREKSGIYRILRMLNGGIKEMSLRSAFQKRIPMFQQQYIVRPVVHSRTQHSMVEYVRVQRG